MTKTAPRARSRATWLGVLLLCALSIGQLGIPSARADAPADPAPTTDAVDATTDVPETVDAGSVEPEPVETVTDVDPETAEASNAEATDGEPIEAATVSSENDVTSGAIEPLPAAGVVATAATPPDLEVTKASNADGVQRRGDRFAYSITVTNVGSEKASGVEVHDELPAGLDVLVPLPSFGGSFCTVASSVVPPGIPFTTVDCGPIPLDGGASATVEIDVRVNGDACGTIANAVDVSGSNEPQANIGADNHAEVSDDVACVPRIRLAASGPSLAHVGDRVRLLFRVDNIGGVDLDAVSVDDTGCDRPATRTGYGNGDTILSPGERWSYVCRHTITPADGDEVHHVATVHASHVGGTVSASDTHDVRVIHPDIAIVVTATPTSGAAGTSIAYAFAVTNTGDTRLRDVAVDDVHGHVATIPSLDPGRTVELTVTGTMGSSPITNVATVAGTDALGRSVYAGDVVTVTVASAGGAGGTPFTGADTGRLTTTIAVLTLSGLGLVLATRRRRRTA